MKTRWLPGNILMPQLGSFEPVQGTFAPNSDPRAATFDECVGIFVKSCNMVCDGIAKDPSVKALIHDLNKLRRIPYEFPLSYVDASRDPVHRTANVCWIVNDDLRWLLKARRILRNATRDVMTGIRKVERSKLEVKVFKTDRALTGKDKTNRAKRWEVLDGDFQHAPLEKCWSAERKLITDLVDFQDFPTTLKGSFIRETLIQPDTSPTLCPVTFEPLVYDDLVESILNPTHGRSQYQVGHLHPLKQEGKHDGANVCWQSADGNRIQGDLTVDETHRLLDQIAERRAKIYDRLVGRTAYCATSTTARRANSLAFTLSSITCLTMSVIFCRCSEAFGTGSTNSLMRSPRLSIMSWVNCFALICRRTMSVLRTASIRN